MRNNKNAFTLIELLSVIVIFAITFLIVVPTINSLIGNSEKREIELIEQRVLSAAKEYVNNFDGSFYKSFYKEGDTGYIYKSDLINAGLIEENEISKLNTFAGVKGELLSNDRIKYTIKYINVSNNNYTNEELYNMIQNISSNENNGSSIIENLKINIKNNENKINENKSNISNMMNKDNNNNIFLQMYPVGSIYVKSTNENPSTMFGGEWKLVDKRFIEGYFSQDYVSNIFTSNSNLSYFYADFIRTGTLIRFRLQLKLANDMTETDLELGTINFSKIGISTPYISFFNHYCSSEDGDGALMVNVLGSTGVVTAIDFITKSASSSFPANKLIYCDFTFGTIMSSMLDSAVSEFHFQRTA